jgi:hypothetical protein
MIPTLSAASYAVRLKFHISINLPHILSFHYKIWKICCSNSENITNNCIRRYVNLYTTDILSLLHVLATYCGHLLVGVFEGYIIKNIKMLYAIFWVILRRLNFMCRHFRTVCSMFMGGERRKNNQDEIARVFTQVKV